MEISLSELRPKLTSVLEQVKAGETIVIMERGVAIAVITSLGHFVGLPGGKMSGSYIAPDGKMLSSSGYTLEQTQARDRGERDLLNKINRKAR